MSAVLPQLRRTLFPVTIDSSPADNFLQCELTKSQVRLLSYVQGGFPYLELTLSLSEASTQQMVTDLISGRLPSPVLDLFEGITMSRWVPCFLMDRRHAIAVEMRIILGRSDPSFRVQRPRSPSDLALPASI